MQIAKLQIKIQKAILRLRSGWNGI